LIDQQDALARLERSRHAAAHRSGAASRRVGGSTVRTGKG
jgi:hypothetical protein